jgi:hypothetical protein
MTEKDLAEVEKQKEELRGIWADHPEEEGENWLDNFFIDVINWHKQEIEKEQNERYWSPCEGCKDGHPSFWKTVVESPQWKLWQGEQSRRLHLLCQEKLPKNVATYDMPEVEECGWISPGHFQEFLKFIIRQEEVKLLDAFKQIDLIAMDDHYLNTGLHFKKINEIARQAISKIEKEE